MLRCCSSQPPHTTCRRSGLPAGPCLPRPRRDPGDASFVGRNRPSSCVYHLVYRTEANHWSSRGGMTCTSMTKQSNDQTLTDCPGDPNVWYIQAWYPVTFGPETPFDRLIRTARMIPLDLASPLVGMAGMTRGIA